MSLAGRFRDHLYRRKCEAQARQCSDSQLKTYLGAAAPSVNSKLRDIEFLVADLEMTGLNPRRDCILSIGTTLIRHKTLIHSQSTHQFVQQTDADLAQSAPIHKIFERDLSSGVALETALNVFLQQAQGRVLVLHHSALDIKFLRGAIKAQYGAKFVCHIADTMLLERKRLQKQGLEAVSLGLASTRQRYGLPNYEAHNATIDALATAELFLAQLSYLDTDNQSTLNDVL